MRKIYIPVKNCWNENGKCQMIYRNWVTALCAFYWFHYVKTRDHYFNDKSMLLESELCKCSGLNFVKE